MTFLCQFLSPCPIQGRGMIRVFSLVGRAGFEPATNGLKARYAISAQGAFPLCAGCIGRGNRLVLPVFCQFSPSSTGAAS